MTEAEPTVEELAQEINPNDPGQGLYSVIGFLGHLNDLERDTVLDPADVADVRKWFTLPEEES